jgi:M6 family metalloprotease-like protein
MLSGAIAAVLAILSLAGTSSAAEGRSPVPRPSASVVGQSAIRALTDDGSNDLRRRRLFGEKAPAKIEAVVLMCDFSDSLMYGRYGQVPGDFPEPAQSEFLYSAHDSVYFAHLLDDVSRYYESVSGGRFELSVTVVGEVANLPHPMGWYGDHPEFGEQKVRLVADTVEALDHLVDFELYDTVMVIHAGAGEETDVLGDSPEQIYSSYLSPDDFLDAVEEEILPLPWIETDDLTTSGDPVGIRHVLLLPETEYQDAAGGAGGFFGSMGVYCFEVGLRLGMLSLSDFTPAGIPDSQGIGQFGLMGYGLFAAGGLIPSEPCAFNKMLMGWLDPYEVEPAAGGTYTLNPAEHPAADSTLARIAIGPSEYWLVEFRLQDPDGNRIFSFTDDVNGNGIPDFYRIDDPTFSPWSDDGRILATFDAAVHVKESLTGGEWDFFMSDNNAREPDVKGAGSGLYVWHVDEGVISRALDSESNIFNADPQRKAVDLEEADGLQDLDSRRSSLWMLGGDDDSFRGEDRAEFGPGTEPNTATAGGAWTGVVIDMVSDVVLDSLLVVGDSDPVIGYAESMTFRCRREAPAGRAPVETAVLDLPGVDLRGSHLLAVDLDTPSDGTLEIVAVGDAGRVFAWNHDLTPRGGSKSVPGLLAEGTDAEGRPVVWTGAPAAGDVDSDGAPEIVVNGRGGTYIFNADGTEVRDGDFDPDSYGLAAPVAEPGAVRIGAPMIVPAASVPTAVSVGTRLVVTLNSLSFEGQELTSQHYEVYDAAGDALVDIPGVTSFTGAGDLPGPVVWDGRFVAVGYNGDAGYVATPGAMTGEGIQLEFEGRPAPWPPLIVDDGILIAMRDGGCIHVGRQGLLAWENAFPVRSPLAPGTSYFADDRFVRAGRFGAPRTSWPVSPLDQVRTPDPERAVSPVSWVSGGSVMTVFNVPDGRLYLYDDAGELANGWPLAGPGEAAATPMALDLDGVPGLELVSAGTMSRIVSNDPGSEPAAEPSSRLVVWSLPDSEDAETVWPMWGGSPSRGHRAPEAAEPPGGDLVAGGSVSVYPAPAGGGDLYARAVVNRAGTIQAVLYNLEGEEVARSRTLPALAGEPAEAAMDIAGAVTGTYVCRIVVKSGGEESIFVKPAAIER